NVRRLEQLWGFDTRGRRADAVGGSLEYALLPGDRARRLRLVNTSGGHFLETMPMPELVKSCLEQAEMRVHQDSMLTTTTLVDAAEEVIVLPAMTRYEQPGGGTSTSTERMVYFSPEIEGPRIGEAKAEWQIYCELAAAVDPERKGLVAFKDAQEIRDEI